MDFDTSFPTLYKKVEEMYLLDPEFTPEVVYTLTENIYREELLVLFKLTTFDQEIINKKVISLYESIKDNDIIRKILNKIQCEDIVSFMLLFSYDYFYLFYPILKGEESDILEKIVI